MILARLYVKIMFHVKQNSVWGIKNESRRDVGNPRFVYFLWATLLKRVSQGSLLRLTPLGYESKPRIPNLVTLMLAG